MLACKKFLVLALLLLGVPMTLYAAGPEKFVPEIFIWIVVSVLLAVLTGGLVEHFRFPSVLGELGIGVVLGNLALVGFTFFEGAETDPIMSFLVEFGVILLLFLAGLEADIDKMMKVGPRALGVALLGVVTPFTLGTFIVGPWAMPGLEFSTYLFIGASLTATSVGISVRVFKDLGVENSSEARIVLGAAVIDDVLGLIVLATIAGMVSAGSAGAGEFPVTSVFWILFKAFAFLVGVIFLGAKFADVLGRFFTWLKGSVNGGQSVIHSHGMKLVFALVFALGFSYIAQIIGLAYIVGAFAGGLVLRSVHFQSFRAPKLVEEIRHKMTHSTNKEEFEELLQQHQDKHVEDLFSGIGQIFIPLFFVVTGMKVDITALFNWETIGATAWITLAAVGGKVISGIVAGKARKSIVGWGMVPRGEVGLIFASTGQALGVVPPDVFSVIVAMVLLTTFLPPIVLTKLLKS